MMYIDPLCGGHAVQLTAINGVPSIIVCRRYLHRVDGRSLTIDDDGHRTCTSRYFCCGQIGMASSDRSSAGKHELIVEEYKVLIGCQTCGLSGTAYKQAGDSGWRFCICLGLVG